VDGLDDIMLGFALLLGIGVFLFAMSWDSSDPRRETARRTSPSGSIAGGAADRPPVFVLLGPHRRQRFHTGAIVVLLLYLGLGFTALAIDRRALLVSALAYVLYALNSLFQNQGVVRTELRPHRSRDRLGFAAALRLLAHGEAGGGETRCRRASRRAAGRRPGALSPHQLHKPAFYRCENGAQFMAPFEHRPILSDQRPHALPVRKAGAFRFYIRALGRAAKSLEEPPPPCRSRSHNPSTCPAATMRP
jgi:hypothetical protein